MDPQFETERYTIPGMIREIGAMNSFLTAIDGQTDRTLSLPCSVALAGRRGLHRSAARLSGLIRHVRTRIDGGGFVSDPAMLDSLRAPAAPSPIMGTTLWLIVAGVGVIRAK